MGFSEREMSNNAVCDGSVEFSGAMFQRAKPFLVRVEGWLNVTPHYRQHFDVVWSHENVLDHESLGPDATRIPLQPS